MIIGHASPHSGRYHRRRTFGVLRSAGATIASCLIAAVTGWLQGGQASAGRRVTKPYGSTTSPSALLSHSASGGRGGDLWDGSPRGAMPTAHRPSSGPALRPPGPRGQSIIAPHEPSRTCRDESVREWTAPAGNVRCPDVPGSFHALSVPPMITPRRGPLARWRTNRLARGADQRPDTRARAGRRPSRV